MPEISNPTAIYNNQFLKDYNIGPAQYKGIQNAQTRTEARQFRTVWQKISDWFFGDNYQVYDQLNLLLRYSKKEEVNLEELHHLMAAFNRLRECSCYDYEELFLVDITDMGNGKFKFYFHIKGLEDVLVPQADNEPPQRAPVDDSQEQREPAYTARMSWAKPLYVSSMLPDEVMTTSQQIAAPSVTGTVDDILLHASVEIDILNQCLIKREVMGSQQELGWNRSIKGWIQETLSQAASDLQRVDADGNWSITQLKEYLGMN